MTSGQPGESRAHRARLGTELRQVRRLAGLSGAQMGERVGISQKTVSRIEHGDAPISLPQVTAWARAARVPADQRAALVALAEAAAREASEFRNLLTGGLEAVQRAVMEAEAQARTMRNFQIGIIPGLLQTAEYARHILAEANPFSRPSPAEIGGAVAVRLERQRILSDPARRLEFLMTEAALRWQPGPAEIMPAQLLQVAEFAALETVDISVIPAGTEVHAIPRCPFILYEDRDDGTAPSAFVELPHGPVYIDAAENVAVYQAEMQRFRQAAVHGDEAAELIREMARAIG